MRSTRGVKGDDRVHEVNTEISYVQYYAMAPSAWLPSLTQDEACVSDQRWGGGQRWAKMSAIKLTLDAREPKPDLENENWK